MTKDAKHHFHAIQYINADEIDIMPKILCFEIIDIIKDETCKQYFRVYETAKISDSSLESTNCYIYLDGVYDSTKMKDIYCKAILYPNVYFEQKSDKQKDEDSNEDKSNSEGDEEKSENKSNKDASDTETNGKEKVLNNIGALKSDHLPQNLVLFLNNYIHDLKEANPELEFEIKEEEFWDEISDLSNTLNQFDNFWPIENNEFESYEINDEINTDIVLPIDTLLSKNEINFKIISDECKIHFLKQFCDISLFN